MAQGTTNAARRPSARHVPRGGFTIVEILVSILVLGTLIALLLLALGRTRAFARATGDRQALISIKTGIDQFKTEFGILPPMVRDNPGALRANSVEPDPAVAGRVRIAVYSLTEAQDAAFLRTLPPANATNPFADPRFSERTLAYYLTGSLARARSATSTLPIDGVPGPGIYKPLAGGGFDVPRDAEAASTSTGTDFNRAGRTFGPFIPVDERDVRVVANPADQLDVSVQDARGVAYRYYRWEPAPVFSTLESLNIPRLVARRPNSIPGDVTPPDRDITAAASVRDARYAIVSPGPNGVFGDEPVEALVARLGGSASEEVKLRLQAERDNVVEVGK